MREAGEPGDEWFGVTATSVSLLSVDPPALLISFDCPARLSPAAAPQAPFGVSVLAASHAGNIAPPTTPMAITSASSP
jgi:flavin reductase (DIM6/NTAB) family NADH-FMN oxidoreductase RutF